MEILLTQADLDAMPAGLRDQLFGYLGKAWPAGGHPVDEAVTLTREQATALLREVSFHRAGAHLHILLERLTYADAARPPARERLTEILGTAGGHLGLYLGLPQSHHGENHRPSGSKDIRSSEGRRCLHGACRHAGGPA